MCFIGCLHFNRIVKKCGQIIPVGAPAANGITVFRVPFLLESIQGRCGRFFIYRSIYGFKINRKCLQVFVCNIDEFWEQYNVKKESINNAA